MLLQQYSDSQSKVKALQLTETKNTWLGGWHIRDEKLTMLPNDNFQSVISLCLRCGKLQVTAKFLIDVTVISAPPGSGEQPIFCIPLFAASGAFLIELGRQ